MLRLPSGQKLTGEEVPLLFISLLLYLAVLGIVFFALFRHANDLIQATVSALSMIPVMDDLSKGGKWAVKLGAAAMGAAATTVATKTIAEVITETIAKRALKATAKEAGQQAVEKVLKENAQVVVTKATKKALQKGAQEAAQVALEKSTKNMTGKLIRDYVTGVPGKQVAEAAAEKKAEKLIKKLPYYPSGSPLGMTPKQLLANKAAQKQLYEMAKNMNAEQAKYAQKLLEELGIDDALSTPLKGGLDAS